MSKLLTLAMKSFTKTLSPTQHLSSTQANLADAVLLLAVLADLAATSADTVLAVLVTLALAAAAAEAEDCLLYTSPSPRDRQKSRMPSSA